MAGVLQKAENAGSKVEGLLICVWAWVEHRWWVSFFFYFLFRFCAGVNYSF